MLPRTPDEMRSMLYMSMISRVYGDITTEARRRRLTEHDIANIERRVLSILRDGDSFAHEFTTFQVEPVIAQVLKELETFFAMTREARIQSIQQK